MTEQYLAVDIGGSKYLIGIVDAKGIIHARKGRPCAGMDQDTLLKNILGDARQVLQEENDRICAVGVTIPGLAEPKKGLWVEASFSGISNLPVKALFEEQFSVDAFLDNDANACAIAEKVFGACKKETDFLYLTISNGIGGALFCMDSIYRGAGGNAGELGHLVVEEGGRVCGCGNRGCLEQYAAGPAILRNYLELGGRMWNEKLDAKGIAELARKGDAIAKQAFELEGHYLAKAFGSAVNLLSVRHIVIGGGVSLAWDLFSPALSRELPTQIYRKANPDIVVEPTPLGYEGGLLGAAALAYCGRRGLYKGCIKH